MQMWIHIFITLMASAVIVVVTYVIYLYFDKIDREKREQQEKKYKQDLFEKEKKIMREVGIWEKANHEQKKLLKQYKDKLSVLWQAYVTSATSIGYYKKLEHSTLKGVAAGIIGGPLYGHVVKKEAEDKNAEAYKYNNKVYAQNYSAKSNAVLCKKI